MKTLQLSTSEVPEDFPTLKIVDKDILIIFEDEIELQKYMDVLYPPTIIDANAIQEKET